MGKDTLQLKADILVEGIRATEEALMGVGSNYKEQNHGLFGWDFEDHGTELLPDDFFLQDGHRAPYEDWYLKNIREFAEITASKHVPASTNHCRKCDGNNMPHDALFQLGLEA